MAERKVTGSGNWSDSTIWEGGQLPTSLDDAVINVEGGYFGYG